MEIDNSRSMTNSAEISTPNLGNNSRGSSYLLFAISIFALCILTGVFYINTLYSPPSNEAVTTEVPTPSIDVKKIPTSYPIENKTVPSTWNQYANPMFKFKVNYPPNWTLKATNDNDILFYNGFRGARVGGVWADISITSLDEYPGARTEFNEHYQSPPGPISVGSGKDATKIANVLINDYNAVKYLEIDYNNYSNPKSETYYINYTFIKDNYIYKISFYTGSKELVNDNREVFDTVISSFQLLK